MPINWSANVRLPYYGWFGQSGFTTERDARDYIARMYRGARRECISFKRPSYAARAYTIRTYVLQHAD